MQNDRDRLKELCENLILSCKSSLCNDCEHNKIDYPHCMSVHFADYLLANGVIVIPCNVGQTVYTIFERKIETLEITQAKTKESKNGIRIDCIAENDFLKMPFSKCHIGNSIFLTKEEAEAKLKELG